MYDELAEYYDLIYADWEASMGRHGAFIAHFLPEVARVLDVSAGIGTQSLPLAAQGYSVTARDLSRTAIRRLGREADRRGVSIDAAASDMRHVGRTVHPPFDAIVCFDNSLPHLLTDAEIVSTLVGFREVLAPSGILLVSIRDYGTVDRGGRAIHRYGERSRKGRRYRVTQEWEPAWTLESSTSRSSFSPSCWRGRSRSVSGCRARPSNDGGDPRHLTVRVVV